MLAELSDAGLEPRLRELAAEGEHGLAIVVEALASKRAALRSAAVRTLHHERDRSFGLTDEAASQQLDRLARLLAAGAPALDGDALSHAAALAERLMALPHTDTRYAARVRDCHTVLAVRAQKQLRLAGRNVPQTVMELAFGRRPAAAQPDRRAHVAFEHAPVAGGGLPVTPANPDPARLPPHLALQARPLHPTDAQPTDHTQPRRLQSPNDETAGGASVMAPTRSAAAEEQSAADFETDQHVIQAFDVNSTSRAETPGTAAVPPPDELARLLELDELARSHNAAEAAAAKLLLLRRGVNEQQRRLARGAVDPDPAIRKEVVEALPLVGSVDARAWLVWLSHDRDAEVRRAALSLLATSSDPRLRRHVRQAADSDPDFRIREQNRTRGN